MKFKKLEVAGFKSFADKLQIKFEKGVTAIVGPNGCGKSNVADSIRWVLGEQSAKSLRGSSMQDLIFNGTQNRKSLSFCEVNLFFDNTEKIFPSLDYKEVVLTRRLYRSGESEYLLNKVNCRLKDLVDLLRDAGMSREGYSIIGQGRIDEILSSKPEERREIFEEAAGILKFKARKKEAERKLIRTEDNLLRLSDILEEKRKQLDPLTKQSENARKWLEFRDRLKHVEINTYIYQYDTASEAKQIISERLDGVKESLELRIKESEETSEKYNESFAKIANSDKQIETLREELMSLTVGLEKQAGEARLLNERLQNLKIGIEKIDAENNALEYTNKNAIEKVSHHSVEKTKCTAELEKLKIEVEEKTTDYVTIAREITAKELDENLRHSALISALERAGDIKSNMSRLLAESENLDKSIEELSSRLKFLTDKMSVEKKELLSLEKECNSFKDDIEKITHEMDAKAEIRQKLYDETEETEKRLNVLNEQYYTNTTRLGILKQMQDDLEGFTQSVKKLLKDASEKKELSKRLHGVVAHLVKVNKEHEVAIEVALGGAVQNIVTTDEEDAKFLIEYLKRQKYGRVTFLPLSSAKPRSLDDRSILKLSGVIGTAYDVIKCEEKFSPIFKALLGSTLLVDNIDTAIAISKQSGYAHRIVTLEGDIIQPSGAITGGSKKSEVTNIFGYEREIAELEFNLKEIYSEVEKLNKQKQEKIDKSTQLTQDLRSMRDILHEKEIQLATKTEAFSKLHSSLDDETVLSGNLEFDLNEQKERFAVIKKDIETVTELEKMSKESQQEALEDSERKKSEFDALRKKRDELSEAMTNAKLSFSSVQHEQQTYEQNIAHLQEEILRGSEKIEENLVQKEESYKAIDKINIQLNSLTNLSNPEDSQKANAIRGKLANLDEFKTKNQEALQSLEAGRVQLMQEIQRLHEAKSHEEILLVKVDTDIEMMKERVAEEYNLTYEECIPFKEEDYNLNEGLAAAAKLKRQMQNLGNVNLNAIEDSKVLFESYNELNTQREDLEKAKLDLNKIIKELSNEMLTRFNDKFEQIRVNFRKTFHELFEGGTADLVLQDAENPLEAGVEIVAQPPQKKLQTISLLSGGERALTAIAILFAILKLRPMPFVVLDEIEAALDETNAARFAKYLHNFAKNTQFIVITHRKPTMELADTLYGVTMEEKGVSKIVSVKLEDASKMSESA
ncbi:MAG: chromosome segregation protein SMC [Firmicutes bacterium]|nr:chromosome segregation protein SMC [Bacillota bacterium]